MKKIIKKTTNFTVLALCLLLLSLGLAIRSCEIKPQQTPCKFDNPLTDLPWLKAKIDEITLNFPGSHIAIYQCTYNNGQIGFLEDRGKFAYLYNCEGKVIDSRVIGIVLKDWSLYIDLANKELIWKMDTDFCEFDNPLTDLYWLKKIVEDFIAYSDTVSNCHFQIYQCTYIEDNNENIGFVVTPICTDCPVGSSMLYKCSGAKWCNNMSTPCDTLYNIAKKRLIWEINN